MYCNRCGKQINSDSKYCPICGAHMPAETAGYTSSWYYMINSNQFGPYSQSQMQEYIAKGLLNQDVLVWANGMHDWVPIYQTGLWQYFPAKPLSNTIAWLMATIPPLLSIIITLLAGFTSFSLPEDFYQSYQFNNVIYGIPFTILYLIDIYKLSKSIYKFSCRKWHWTGLISPPLYLFLRAGKTNKRYGYAFTWCILFVIDIWISIIIL